MRYFLKKLGWALAISTLVAAGLGFSSRRVGADLIVGNTGDTPKTAFVTSVLTRAQEFSTPNQSYTLTSILAVAYNVSGTYTGFAELVADNGNTPQGGTVLTTFTFPTLPSSSGNTEFDPTTSGITLAANTNYWFVLGNSKTNSNYHWDNTTSTAISGTGTLGLSATSADGGMTWTTSSSNRQLIQVNGTPTSVPEPSPLLLLGMAGMIGLGLWLDRRIKKKGHRAILIG